MRQVWSFPFYTHIEEVICYGDSCRLGGQPRSQDAPFNMSQDGRPKTTLESILSRIWWRSGWESACQCRGRGFEPWSGKIPHAAEQLGPWATTTEPARLEPVLRNKRGRDSERPAHRDEERPPPTRRNWRKPSRRNEDPTQLKINK